MKKHFGWVSTVVAVTIVFSVVYAVSLHSIRTSVSNTRIQAVPDTAKSIKNQENQLLRIVIAGWVVALVPLAIAPILVKKRTQKHHKAKKKA
jgi:hypothetical protein